MKLPNAATAVVSEKKITAYLLNPTHPDGAGKARFFASLGFRVEEWEVLAKTLRRIATDWPTEKRVESPHGTKYIIHGRIDTPRSGLGWVRTVWIIDSGETTPRLVTAYPAEPGEELHVE